MKKQRLILSPKDICVVMGISERHARRLFRNIKDAYGKKAHHLVTVSEFAQYTDIPAEDIRKILGQGVL